MSFDRMSFIEDLPDEILLKIFQELTPKDLGKCAQVCKKFQGLSKDESIWCKINLNEKRINPELIAHALKTGTKYLSLFDTRVTKFGDTSKFPKENKLKYLNLSYCLANGQFLLQVDFLKKRTKTHLGKCKMFKITTKNCFYKAIFSLDCTIIKPQIKSYPDS